MYISKMNKLIKQLDSSWEKILLDKELDDSYKSIDKVLDNEKSICPPRNMIFNAFKYFKANEVKVVLIGQDPYHSVDKSSGIKHANGMAFSISKGVKNVPPSLRNIFKEIGGSSIRTNGNLEDWAKQGVLLINKVLTVKPGKAKSHNKIGWETVTKHVITQVANLNKNTVFILLGRDAQSMQRSILKGNKEAYILCAGHPSPMNKKGNFLGSQVFEKTNELLEMMDIPQIKWN
jgi:uracil-DNA glycosylase